MANIIDTFTIVVIEKLIQIVQRNI